MPRQKTEEGSSEAIPKSAVENMQKIFNIIDKGDNIIIQENQSESVSGKILPKPEPPEKNDFLKGETCLKDR